MKRKFSEMNSEVCYSEDFNIFKACKFANVDYIIKYIEQNGDVNLTDKNLNSLLHYSVMFGDQYTTRLLLMNGADINKYNIMGISPLQLAIYRKNKKIIELLNFYLMYL